MKEHGNKILYYAGIIVVLNLDFRSWYDRSNWHKFSPMCIMI